MIRRKLGPLVLALAAPIAGPALAADLPALLEQAAAQHAAGDAAALVATLREALHGAWLEAPLHVRTAVLARDSGRGYGLHRPREDNRYAPGESILIYVEPVGYGYRRDGETWRFGFDTDLLVLDEAGKVLGGQEDMMRVELESRNPVTEFNLDLTYTLTGLAPGVYVLRTTLRDRYSDERVSFENEVEITAD